jgi:hypothetical protein
MAITNFPAEQNPAVDPELPQPAGQQRITTPFPANTTVAQTSASVLNAIAATGGALNANTLQSFLANQGAAAGTRLRQQQALQASYNQPSNGDWRVKIRLAPESTYLYRSAQPGILAPLAASDGVIFPYTPSISTSYNANYDVTDLTHSNYRGQFYKNSNVGDITVTGTFTAQDTVEAEYVLAVIHFFRSVTKMFYGQDPERGTPPPLVYLTGLGQFQFNNHPCVVRSFNYALPTDVDYIRTQPNNFGNLLNRRTREIVSPANTVASVLSRLANARDILGNILQKGAKPPAGSDLANTGLTSQAVSNTNQATYVPTKLEISLILLPIQTRSQVSQQFSLKGFAKGDLLKDGFW